MKYALGNMLNGYGVRGLDADAKAYIDAVVAAGATVTSTQRNAINAFVKGGKKDGWWASMKRIYLPIWSIASPNAIDMIGRTSGTFAGGVTHASGYVQGNGSTGYFNFNVTPASLGLTLSSAAVFSLVNQAPSGTAAAVIVGSLDGNDTNKVFEISHQSTTIIFRAFQSVNNSGAVQASLARSSQVGVLIGSREGGSRRIVRRISSGVTTLVDTTGVDFGTVPVTGQLNAMRSTFGNGAAYSDGRYGAYGVSIGLTNSQSEKLSENLKNMWETCTGLLLP